MKQLRKGMLALVAAMGIGSVFTGAVGANQIFHAEGSFAETSGHTVRACDSDAADGHRVRAWIWSVISGYRAASPWWAGPAGGCTGYWDPASTIGLVQICVETEGCSAWGTNYGLVAVRPPES